MLIKSGSLEGYNFIKRKEGIKLIAYQCSARSLDNRIWSYKKCKRRRYYYL